MNKVRILYNSSQVRKGIIKLFSSSRGRRVAISAFVGRGAEAYLPKSAGLELVCWPKAGGTNPHAVRQLMKRGVQVTFADSLHMKVYWTEDKGAIITSANLSTNALGAGNLHELGIFLPAGGIDIDRILSSIQQREVSNRELLQLDKLHQQYQKRTGFKDGRRQGISFHQWYELQFRPAWKLGWWDSDGTASSNAKKLTREQYEIPEPYDFLGCTRKNYKDNDWVLTFALKTQSPSAIRWMCVDHIVPIPKSDKRIYSSDYPYQAVQVWPPNRYPAPPFRIDKQFSKAFRQAVREFGADQIKDFDLTVPTKRFIDLIHDE